MVYSTQGRINCQAQVQVQIGLTVSAQEICHKHLQIMLKSRVSVMAKTCNTEYCNIASDLIVKLDFQSLRTSFEFHQLYQATKLGL